MKNFLRRAKMLTNWGLIIGALIVDEIISTRKPLIVDFNCPDCWKGHLHLAKVEAVELKR